MELTKQVCSLELAKRLKEFGVRQESLFSYGYMTGNPEYESNYELCTSSELNLPEEEMYAAFTVAELDEILSKYGEYSVTEYKDEIAVQIVGKGEIYHKGNRADARAEMLIYLLENKLITP